VKKIPTVFVRDWEGTLGPPARFVLNEPHPDCAWVFAGEGVATQKLDGTACLVRDGVLYKRLELKGDKPAPDGFELVEHDEETGKRVGWVPVGDGPEDRWHREAFGRSLWGPCGVGCNGTYELVGPKVQGNPEGFAEHTLVSHDLADRLPAPREYEALREWLATQPIEGIVWHHPDGRMAKIKKKDFGLARKEE
jgi:hypothetical protein